VTVWYARECIILVNNQLDAQSFLTCICLRSRLFRMILVTAQASHITAQAPHISWRHTGAIDLYWYVYHVSLDEFRSFSKRYASYVIRKHMCGSAGCGGVGNFVYIYSNSLHVSNTHMLIIRRINCINTTSGICHSMYVTYTRCRIDKIDSLDDEHMGVRNM
jgi:hypothetical protein